LTKSKTNRIDGVVKTDRRNSDLVFNRMMIVMIAAAAVIIGLLYIKRGAVSGISRLEVQFVMNALPIVTIICTVLFAAALVYFILQRVRKADESTRLVTSWALLGMTSVVFFVSVFYKTLTGMYSLAVVIAAAILYFVYCLYNRDFFWCSIVAAAGSFLLLSGRSVFPVFATASQIAAILLSLAAIVFFLIVKKNGGKLLIKDKKIAIMKRDYQYVPLFTLAALVIAFAILTLITTSLVIYCIMALLAVYLLFGIIYTVKMI